MGYSWLHVYKMALVSGIENTHTQKKTYNSCDHSLNQPSQSLLILLVLPKFWCLLQPAKTCLGTAYPFGKWAWALLCSFWSASNSKRRALIDPVAPSICSWCSKNFPSPLPWFVLISVYFYWCLISMIFTVYTTLFPMILPGFFSLPPNICPFTAGTCFAFKRSMISCQRLGDLRVSMVVPISNIRGVNKQN